MKRKTSRRVLAALGLALVLAAVPAAMVHALDALEAGQGQETTQRLTQALRRGCVTCYATEGSYPQSLEYLEEHYGLQIDRSRYAVFYSPSGSNLMPQITVLECRP